MQDGWDIEFLKYLVSAFGDVDDDFLHFLLDALKSVDHDRVEPSSDMFNAAGLSSMHDHGIDA